MEFFADRRPDNLLLLHVFCHGVKDEGGEPYFAAANARLRRQAATGVLLGAAAAVAMVTFALVPATATGAGA